MIINLAQTIANNVIHAAALMTAEGNPGRNAAEVDDKRCLVVNLFRCVLPESRAGVASEAEATAAKAFDDDPPASDAARDFLTSCLEAHAAGLAGAAPVDPRGAEPLRNTAGAVVRWQCRVCGLVASSQEFAAACCNKACECGALIGKSVFSSCTPCRERHRAENRAAWSAEQEHVSPEEWGGPVFWDDNSSYDINEAVDSIFDEAYFCGDEPGSPPDYFECAEYVRLDSRTNAECIAETIIERIGERFGLEEGYTEWKGWRLDLLEKGLSAWLKACEVQWSVVVKGKIITGEAFEAYARASSPEFFEDEDA